MKLYKQILTQNACYQAGRTIAPTGIMLHSTGANNPWLKRYVGPDDGLLWTKPVWKSLEYSLSRWKGSLPTCVHRKNCGWIYCDLSDFAMDLARLACGWRANNTHIGIEICEDGLTDQQYFQAVYQEAVEVCAHLCQTFALHESAIICHSEGFKLGVASNHADVLHWFPYFGKDMNQFRKDVGEYLIKKSTLC